MAVATKCAALGPGFPGSVSLIKGVKRGEFEMALPQAHDPKHLILFHPSTSALLPPGGDILEASVYSPLTSSLCFNHRSISDVGGSGMRQIEQVRERESSREDLQDLGG